MHERDDEDLALAQVIEDAPGIGGISRTCPAEPVPGM
jgi:hypothetical protein